jgi:hypothetical protein
MHDNKTLPTTAILMDRTGNSNGTRLVTLVTDVLKEEYTIRSHDKHKSSPKEKNPKPCIVAYNSNSSSFAPRWIWKEISPYTMYLTCTKSLTSMIPLGINELGQFLIKVGRNIYMQERRPNNTSAWISTIPLKRPQNYIFCYQISDHGYSFTKLCVNKILNGP